MIGSLLVRRALENGLFGFAGLSKYIMVRFRLKG